MPLFIKPFVSFEKYISGLQFFKIFQFPILALIVFARFWRILRVINGVIVGTKSDADTRARDLKKKIAVMENHEYDNQVFQENLQEAIEENARLNLLRRGLQRESPLRTPIF